MKVGRPMKDFYREDPLFSLCGLNCALCPMHLGGWCPGCGGGPGNQPCAVARCSREHGGIEYCCFCGEYPCERLAAGNAYDTFISHRNRQQDLERFCKIGQDAYRAELDEKAAILEKLLDIYNDGRHKGFFCSAVNLLPLPDLREIMQGLAKQPERGSAKERAAAAAVLLQTAADRQGISLKLRKKPKKII